MVKHGSSLELPLQHQNGYLTQNNRFFVCNSGSSPEISTADYTLRVWGEGVERELNLDYSDLLAMRQRKVAAIIECAGNHRALFHEIDGKRVETPKGTAALNWSTGAVGMAEWEGVSLGDVLRLAGIKKQAVHVCAAGSEDDSLEGCVRLPLPVDKAMDKNTLLALRMNSEPLGIDHGYPVRVLVPGWIGAYSIKWVQDIELSCQKVWVRRNTESYVMMGDQWPHTRYAPSRGKPLTSLNIKSALALPYPAQLNSGQHRLYGYARSPGQKIATVECSDDDGQTWFAASLSGANEIYGWVRFEFEWLARAGRRSIMTRATDVSGRVQPDKVPFNSAGYLYNAVYPHPICVCD